METLQTFVDKAGENATHTLKMAVLGTWVEKSLLKQLHKATFFSIMAD